MPAIIKCMLNDAEMLHYDKSLSLTEKQLNVLNQIDSQMDKGINLSGEHIDKPDRIQKAQFVAFSLLSALENNNDQQAIAFFSYLVNKVENLKQLKAIGEKGKYKVEFVMDKDFSNWQKIEFH